MIVNSDQDCSSASTKQLLENALRELVHHPLQYSTSMRVVKFIAGNYNGSKPEMDCAFNVFIESGRKKCLMITGTRSDIQHANFVQECKRRGVFIPTLLTNGFEKAPELAFRIIKVIKSMAKFQRRRLKQRNGHIRRDRNDNFNIPRR